MYKRNYSNFSEDSFRDDVSLQNFNNNFGHVSYKLTILTREYSHQFSTMINDFCPIM